VAVPAGVAGGSAEISQQLGGAIVSEFGDGVAVGAAGARGEVWEADDGAVPAQEFEEQRLPHLVGCSAQWAQQLVHVAHPRCRLRQGWLVQASGGDESGDEVGDAVGFGVGEVEALASDEGAGGAEWFEPVEDSGRG